SNTAYRRFSHGWVVYLQPADNRNGTVGRCQHGVNQVAAGSPTELTKPRASTAPGSDWGMLRAFEGDDPAVRSRGAATGSSPLLGHTLKRADASIWGHPSGGVLALIIPHSTEFAQFIGVCSRSKPSTPVTTSSLRALCARAGSTAGRLAMVRYGTAGVAMRAQASLSLSDGDEIRAETEAERLVSGHAFTLLQTPIN